MGHPYFVIYSTHPILALGLCTLIGEYPEAAVGGVYANLNEFVGALQKTEGAIAVMDVNEEITIPLISRLRDMAPCARITFWGKRVGEEFAIQAIELGVCGIIDRNSPVQTHREFLRAIASGERWIDPELGARASLCCRCSLTPRERELLCLLATGGNNQDIAGVLGISISTIKVHLSRLFRKLNANDRLDLAILAWKNLNPRAPAREEWARFQSVPLQEIWFPRFVVQSTDRGAAGNTGVALFPGEPMSGLGPFLAGERPRLAAQSRYPEQVLC
jgi:DNA-binding NarL/FixJ family response regulator